MQADKDLTYAVIGASREPTKYGHIVFRDLLEAGFDVIPINPNADEILGEKSYASISEAPEKIDVVVTVVPPEITEKVLMEVLAAGVNKVWMQPGSSSHDAIEYCEKHSIECSDGRCIMVERRKL